jgi:hypothetical protein
MRSFRSSGGDSDKSSWSGGGGSSRSRNLSNPAWSGGGGNHDSAQQFRNFSGGNFSGGNPAGQSGDASRQYRAFRAQSGEGSNRNFSGGGSARQNANNDQLQQMFKQYEQQQAAGGNSSATFDRSRGRNWNSGNRGGEQTAFNQLPGANGNSNRGRGNWNRSGSGGDDDSKQTGDLNNLNRFRNGGGDFGGGGKDDQFGKWSKKDGDGFDPKTARWFGKSGFGDHRDRSEFREGGRDEQFADHVRKDWQQNWWKEHGHHGDDDHDDHGQWGHGRWDDDDHFPFASSWWAGHRRHHAPFHVYWRDRRWRDQPFYWWNSCSAPVLTTWIRFGWNYPCYWDYGPGEYITYYNNTVYVDNQRYATALDYYAQVRNLARSVPTLTQDQLAAIEWLPLGVFAVTRPSSNQANELLQLAVSKDGILSGTLLDQRTGQARPLQGMVEQTTQKAAWCFADSRTDALVVETSLYNLTEPECTALAHLDAVNTEVWQLVRLEQPQPPAGQVGAPAPAAQPAVPPHRAVK